MVIMLFTVTKDILKLGKIYEIENADKRTRAYNYKIIVFVDKCLYENSVVNCKVLYSSTSLWPVGSDYYLSYGAQYSSIKSITEICLS